MKAVIVDPGAPGKLGLGEVEQPTPKADEALVKVAATSLNLGEVRMAQEADAGSRIGWDVAGTVERAAADGSGPKEGARVVGLTRTGAWSQVAAVPTDALAQIPDEVTFVQAATLPVAGLTALFAVQRGGELLAGRALVTGANGGVGHIACQIARLVGAHVVALVRREEYREMMKSYGADDVVVSEDGSAAEQYGPYRLICESVGGKVLPNVLGMLDKGGICVTYGASAGGDVALDIWSLIGIGRASLYGLTMRNEFAREPASSGLSRLAVLVAQGKLKVNTSREESWEKVGETARDLLDRKIPGKAVLHIS